MNRSKIECIISSDIPVISTPGKIRTKFSEFCNTFKEEVKGKPVLYSASSDKDSVGFSFTLSKEEILADIALVYHTEDKFIQIMCLVKRDLEDEIKQEVKVEVTKMIQGLCKHCHIHIDDNDIVFAI